MNFPSKFKHSEYCNKAGGLTVNFMWSSHFLRANEEEELRRELILVEEIDFFIIDFRIEVSRIK